MVWFQTCWRWNGFIEFDFTWPAITLLGPAITLFSLFLVFLGGRLASLLRRGFFSVLFLGFLGLLEVIVQVLVEFVRTGLLVSQHVTVKIVVQGRLIKLSRWTTTLASSTTTSPSSWLPFEVLSFWFRASFLTSLSSSSSSSRSHGCCPLSAACYTKTPCTLR